MASQENMINFLKSHRHFYVELRAGDCHGHNVYYCVLCAASLTTNAAIVTHLTGKAHIRKLHFAKQTLLTTTNRWPFSDGILFFDSSIRFESEGSIAFPTITNDRDLSIEEFNYEQVPSSLSYDCRYKIYFHDHAQRIGKGSVSVRHDSKDAVEKVWCEWLGGNDLNFDAMDQKSVVKVIVFPYSDDLGRDGQGNGMRAREYCAICDQKMMIGKDVASILHLNENERLEFGQILCCTDANVRRRYEDRLTQFQNQVAPDVTFQKPEWPKDRNKEFHFFHTSCLIHWIMWREYVKCTALESVPILDDLFCPECNAKKDGQKYYNESQMAMVKSRILQAKNEWTNNHESLQNSSIGLHFPLQSGDKQTQVRHKGYVHFYRTVYQGENYHSEVF